jgi:hypothetical protein
MPFINLSGRASKMTHYNTILNYTGNNGAMPLLYSIRDGIPYAFDGLLLVIFIIIFASQYFLIKNRTGRAKVLISLLSSSFMMIILSMMLALSQLVTYKSVILYAFLTIISFILFILSDNT